jgi:hypothetical protein
VNLSYEFTQGIGKRWGSIYLLPAIEIGYDFDKSIGSRAIYIGVEFLFWSLYVSLRWR